MIIVRDVWFIGVSKLTRVKRLRSGFVCLNERII